MSESSPAGSPSTVLIVIVNYRTAGLVIDCLQSLEPQILAHPGARVVVTDNLSPDDSVDRLAAAIRDRGWGGWVELRPLGSNSGFAAGNNAAIVPALASPEPPRYIWLLNSDTIARPGALAALVEFMDARPEVGIAGSRLEDLDGSRQHSGYRFPSVLGELDFTARFYPLHKLIARWTEHPTLGDQPREVDWVCGASLFARREVFEAIGLLDDGYFMYYEEVDFCLRAKRAGWPCWYVPAARIVHLGGASTGVIDRDDQAARRVPPYWFDARRRYFVRNHGRATARVADVAWVVGALSFRVRKFIQRKPDILPERHFRDFLRFNILSARPR